MCVYIASMWCVCVCVCSYYNIVLSVLSYCLAAAVHALAFINTTLSPSPFLSLSLSLSLSLPLPLSLSLSLYFSLKHTHPLPT